MASTQTFPIVTYTPILVNDGERGVVENLVCLELPLEIRINGSPHVTLMRTPGLDKELAVGFCFTDKIIATVADIHAIRCITPQNTSWVTAVELTIPKVEEQPALRRSVIKSSSAGVHNAHIFDNLPAIPHEGDDFSEPCFELSVLDALPEKLSACQVLRSKCHSTHGTALFNRTGERVCCTEDVGRHNALDKLIGIVLLNNLTPGDKILMLSSRASCEMIQKAGRIGFPVVATISAPTDLALQMADRLKCTYVSFRKKGGYYIYTHPWRFGLGGEGQKTPQYAEDPE